MIDYARQTWDHPSPLSRFAHRDRLRRSLDIVAAAVPGGGSILDIGCGDGAFLRLLRRKRPDLILSGYDPAAPARADAFTPLPSLEAAEECYDCITCLETVEHLENEALVHAVEFARDHLAPKGIFLATSPIMIGPAVCAKELTRMALFRRASDHGLGELLRAAFLCRPPARAENRRTSHKGYDFRHAHRQIGAIFQAGERSFDARTGFGPFPRLPYFLNSQAYLVISEHAMRPVGGHVQYGCGWSAPEGWRNFDSSPTLRFERMPLIGRLYTRNSRRFPDNVEYGDIVKGLPVAEQSFDGAYCSHVLEHLSLTDCRAALTNTYKILRPGGVFRLVVPDLEYMVNRYIEDPSGGAARALMMDTGLGWERRDRGFRRFAVSWLGNSRHLWMWDFRAIAEELGRAGFAGIRRAGFGDCPDAAFSEVEDRDRWENCLGVECRRPG